MLLFFNQLCFSLLQSLITSMLIVAWKKQKYTCLYQPKSFASQLMTSPSKVCTFSLYSLVYDHIKFNMVTLIIIKIMAIIPLPFFKRLLLFHFFILIIFQRLIKWLLFLSYLSNLLMFQRISFILQHSFCSITNYFANYLPLSK